ncbi:hypothetical protein BDB01DRAFT_831808 [Pilobolus umbonatus]|nr:hypothetical protein BDB01DRAFT_831808 [Pilobolus umbonatus]
MNCLSSNKKRHTKDLHRQENLGKENYPPNDPTPLKKHIYKHVVKSIVNNDHPVLKHNNRLEYDGSNHNIVNKPDLGGKRKTEDRRELVPDKRIRRNHHHHSITLEQNSILTLSRRLKENMTRVTYKMIEDLSQSTQPQDVIVYEQIVHQMTPAHKDTVTKTLDKYQPECLSSDGVDRLSISTANHTEIIKNLSFNTQEEDEFITTWLGTSEFDVDSFSITVEEEEDKYQVLI